MNTKSTEILTNPKIIHAAKVHGVITELCAKVATKIISKKMWKDMSEQERNLCVKYLISESESEDDLRRRLSGIGVLNVFISWKDVDPNDQTSLEAQMLIKALHGPIAKNGALVMYDIFN